MIPRQVVNEWKEEIEHVVKMLFAANPAGKELP
ncbi:hypothetical protein SDC9_93293 [bioreactor metagenome]|jgi:hypothetical protein|uniref:Uncharacterized protein n=1 Tax=bioreactor metagenome TaxID=1076179 RepID=A0A645A046_9ZZZZ